MYSCDWWRQPREEEKKERKITNVNKIHHICVGTRHKETLQSARKCSGRGLH
jgi:hypothetical protein